MDDGTIVEVTKHLPCGNFFYRDLNGNPETCIHCGKHINTIPEEEIKIVEQVIF